MHTDHQVTCTVVSERGVERDGRPTGVERHGAAKHHVVGRDRLPVGVAREVASRDVLHEDVYQIRLRIGARHVETDGIDGAGSPNFAGSVNLLNERVAPKAIVRGIISGTRTISNGVIIKENTFFFIMN